MENVARDLRFALRILLLHPGFTAVAVLSLALGIGANSTIFSAVNSVLLKPLPFRQPEQLVRLYERYVPNQTLTEASGRSFLIWQEMDTFQALALARSSRVSLIRDEEARRVEADEVSEDFFRLLGRPMSLGRAFEPSEVRASAEVAVIGFGLWQRDFASDEGVLGRSIRVDGREMEIVGVAPPGYGVLGAEKGRGSELWIPLSSGLLMRQDGDERQFRVWGRLADDANLSQARIELRTLSRSLELSLPDSYRDWDVHLAPLRQDLLGDSGELLSALLAAVGLVLMIACANVANLLLSRSSRRRREIALRAALGAPRRRLLGQLVVENLLLAVLSGAVGLLLALWGVDVLRSLFASWLPRAEEISLDWQVFLFTLLVSLLAGLLFGLGPAWKASRPNLSVTLRNVRTATGTTAEGRVRGVLVVSEVALAMVLLIAAGVLIRTVLALQAVDPGYQADKVLAMELRLPSWKYQTAAHRENVLEALAERLQRLAGVETTAFSASVPPLPGVPSKVLMTDYSSGGRGELVDCFAVSPAYWKTLGIGVVTGRLLLDKERRRSPAVVISRSFANLLGGPGEAIGARLRLRDGSGRFIVVGVVEDVRRDPRRMPSPAIYLPFRGGSPRPVYVLIRGQWEPSDLTLAVTSALQRLDPDLAADRLAPLDQLGRASTNRERLSMLLLSGFAGLALVMAAVGIFGVLSFVVSERFHEIGIRMAFGARRRDILRRVLGQGMGLALAGIVVGVVGSFLASGLLTRLLHTTRPADPATYLFYALVLSAVALLACSVPALRATRVQPMKTLRYE
ncbi:MAG TPA: ABC transporter permease [Acidobacteriota bacterium]|nr:ABC transporter permease [Acidobacteriota bacterium]